MHDNPRYQLDKDEEDEEKEEKEYKEVIWSCGKEINVENIDLCRKYVEILCISLITKREDLEAVEEEERENEHNKIVWSCGQ